MLARPENATTCTDATDIKCQIRRFIAQQLLFSDDRFDYEDDASFLENGIIDSVGVLELILFLEQTFGITIGGQDMVPDNFDSVNNLARYVERQTGAA